MIKIFNNFLTFPPYFIVLLNKYTGWFGQDYGIDKYAYSAIGLAGAAILKICMYHPDRMMSFARIQGKIKNSSLEGLKVGIISTHHETPLLPPPPSYRLLCRLQLFVVDFILWRQNCKSGRSTTFSSVPT